MITRRAFSGLAAGALASTSPASAQENKLELQWTNGLELAVEGLGFKDLKSPWDRLPARAEAVVRPEVWNLSRQPAGVMLRFFAETPSLHARWQLRNKTFAGAGSTGIASSGLDLYARTPEGVWRWMGFGRPNEFPLSTATLIQGIKPTRREYALYLPLHNPVDSLEVGVPVGVPGGAKLEAAPPRSAKPIVFYGTSITHGYAASRPGMVHTAILGRRFDRPVINLGFSGNGRLELEVAKFLVEIDAAVYVIDCLPNVVAQQVAERTVPLVEAIRQARPETPILLVEDRTYQDSYWVESKMQRNIESRLAFRKAYIELLNKNVKHLQYLGGENLLGNDGEGTIDSSHPNDLGFVRQADAFEPFLAYWLR